MIEADPSWSARWPGAQAGFLALQNVSNPSLCPPLESCKQALENELRLHFGAENAAALPGWGPLPAYASYYRAFDKTYHVLGQLKSVAVKGKAIPSVAALVEAMFIAELHNGLLTAGHDLARISGTVRIAAAQGGETYLGLRGETLTLNPAICISPTRLESFLPFWADRTGVRRSRLIRRRSCLRFMRRPAFRRQRYRRTWTKSIHWYT